MLKRWLPQKRLYSACALQPLNLRAVHRVVHSFWPRHGYRVRGFPVQEHLHKETGKQGRLITCCSAALKASTGATNKTAMNVWCLVLVKGWASRLARHCCSNAQVVCCALMRVQTKKQQPVTRGNSLVA
jgi:hypothetical protein